MGFPLGLKSKIAEKGPPFATENTPIKSKIIIDAVIILTDG